MATDGGDDRWRNVLDARSITVRPVDGDPVDLQEYLDGLGGGDVTVAWADVTGKPATYPPATHTHTAADVGAAPASHTHTAAQVSDASTVGRSVLTAADAAAARSAIGAGTSSLAVGTGAAQAAAGNHTHPGLLTGTASAVADSEAADVAAMVADFNALLAALRARGVIT